MADPTISQSLRASSTYFFGLGDEVIIGVLLGGLILWLVYKCFKWFSSNGNEENQRANSTSANQTGTMTYHGRLRSDDYECSICLGDIFLAVETNCGHTFCGTCAFAFYDFAVTGPLTPPNCPMCRQRITLFLPYFSQNERDSIELDVVTQRDMIMDKICQFNRRFSGSSRSYLEILKDLPMLARHLWTRLRDGEGLDLFFRARAGIYLVITVLYVVMPLDILPEAVLGIVGLLDDVLFSLVVLVSLTNQFRTILGHGE